MILYLKSFESLFVILGDFVRSDQLDVVAITRVAHNVILQRRKSKQKRDIVKAGTQIRCIITRV